MSKDFATLDVDYKRNAEAILGKLKEPHEVITRKVSEEWTPVDILLIGEAPGSQENIKGLPFVGKSGTLLRGVLDGLLQSLPDLKWGLSNVVKCQPPLNRDPTKTEVNACSPELEREVKARKPKVVVPLGNFSLEYFTGRTGITAVQGAVMTCRNDKFKDMKLWIVPCLHPAYVLRADHEMDKFVAAITTAIKVAIGEYENMKGDGEYYVIEDVETVEELMAQFRRNKNKVACDTETGNLIPQHDKFPRLLCLSFSDEEGIGYTIPLDHRESPWCIDPPKLEHVSEFILPDPPRKGSKKRIKWEEGNRTARFAEFDRREKEHFDTLSKRMEERLRVVAAVKGFYEDESVSKVLQNAKFDQGHIRFSLGCEVRGELSDTMLRHLTIEDQRRTHGLEVLSYQYTGMGGYHKPLDDWIKEHIECDPEKGGSYANIPGSLLFSYAGCDTDATIRVENRLLEDEQYRNNPKLQRLAEKFFPRLSNTLGWMEYNGAKVDLDVVKKMDVELTAEAEVVLEEMKRIPQVRQFIADQLAAGKKGKKKGESFEFNPGSDRQVGKILFDYYACRPSELTDTGFKILAARYARLYKDNPALEFHDVIDASIRNKEWDFYSTKALVLEDYKSKGVDFAPLILTYREKTKLLGTYIHPLYDFADSNNIVHGNFSIIATTTGRLAVYDPALQTIPGGAKAAYTTRFGEDGVLLFADLSQIELRVCACLSSDPPMLQAYREGADFHTLTAISISGSTPEGYKALPDAKRKWWRTLAKRVNFGIVYSIGAAGLVNTLKTDGVIVTSEYARELIDVFFAAHPVLVNWIRELQSFVRQYGYFESPMGRIRRLPEVFSSSEEIIARALRQAGNFPIQSSSADMTLMALVLIDEWMRKEKMRSKCILTVHDSIGVDTVADETLLIAGMMKEVMENLPDYADDLMPGMDWSWLQVPIIAEFDAGKNWHDCCAFDPVQVIEEKLTPQDAKWNDACSKYGCAPHSLHFTDEKGEFKHRAPQNAEELFELIDLKAVH